MLPTPRSRFTTLINNLSVKHIIEQQLILFHRFFGRDLTDELFIDVGAGGGGERFCRKGKDKESSKWNLAPSFPQGFCRRLVGGKNPPLTSISPTLSTERELPGADKSPVICQTSPSCPALPFSCILLSVIESANSEKLLSIWTQSSTCETQYGRFFCCF